MPVIELIKKRVASGEISVALSFLFGYKKIPVVRNLVSFRNRFSQSPPRDFFRMSRIRSNWDEDCPGSIRGSEVPFSFHR